MCFPVTECLFCIRLDTATKIIGFVYMILNAALIVLFGVPVILAWKELPFFRVCFYISMTVSSLSLFLSAFLLVVAASTKRPSLMRPWVVTAWGTSVALLAVCLAGMVTIPLRLASAAAASEESLIISVYIVHAMLLYYFASVVNSRLQELKRERSTKYVERLMYPTRASHYLDHA